MQHLILVFLITFLTQKLDATNEMNITYLESNPFEKISHKEFLFKIDKEFSNKQRLNSNKKLKSKFKSFITVLLNDQNRSDQLKEFLSSKIVQYFDEINMLLIPEFKPIFENIIKIIKMETKSKEVEYSVKIGTLSCNLDQLAEIRHMTVCSWHWILVERESIFPFIRANAKCNCENCQAKTIYDSDKFKFSKCKPIYSLLPALTRESITNDVEKWVFSLEEVSTACVCSLTI